MADKFAFEAARLGRAYGFLKNLRRDLERELRVTLEERMQRELAEFEDVVAKAHEMGMSKARIAREMGTSNRNKVHEMIDNANARKERLGATTFDDTIYHFIANDDNTVSVKWDGYVSELKFPFLHDQLGDTPQDGFNADLDMTVKRNANGAWTVLDHGNNVVKLFDGTVTRPSHGLVKGDLDESEAALPGAKLGRLLSEWEATR